MPDCRPGSAAVGVVAVDEVAELLGGVAAQRVDVDVAVLGDDQLEERLAVLLDLRRAVLTTMPSLGLRGAGGDRVAHALDLDDAEPAAAEGLEPVVVAEGGNVLAVRLATS